MAASHVVMIRPLTFCSNPDTISTNSFQKEHQDLSPEEVIRLAQAEFDGIQKKLKDHGIAVSDYTEIPGAETPDACFPNNWFCHLPDGKLFIFPMRPMNRRREVRQDILQNIPHSKMFDLSAYKEKSLFLEGTGSLILDHEFKLGYACLSSRTSPELMQVFSQLSGYKMLSFDARDGGGQEIYHTNVMMALGQKNVVINLSAVQHSEEKKLIIKSFEDTGKEIIDISHEQMNHFAGNCLYLSNKKGENFWVMSSRAFESFTLDQRNSLESEGKFIHAPIPTIEDLGGGGVRCLMAEIFV